MGNGNRSRYQKKIISELWEKSARGGIHLAEIPTGGGKGKILLDLARKAAKEGRTVILSTANNFLVAEMYGEAVKFRVPQSGCPVRIAVGRENYLDPDIALSEMFLGTFGLGRDEVEGWLEKHEGLRLSALFVRDFNLPDEAEEILRGEPEERKLEDVRSEMEKEPGLWITNHYYLLAMMRGLREGALDGTLILADEFHMLNPVAREMFRHSFSPWRLSYLVREAIVEGSLPKSHIPKFRNLAAKMDEIVQAGRGGMEEAALLAELAAVRERPFYEGVRKYLGNKSPKAGIVKKARAELMEMEAVLADGRRGAEVTVGFSAVKRNPTFSVATGDPVLKMRSLFARHDFDLIGVSGTLRTSPEKSLGANRWIFERTGFVEFPEKVAKESESARRFNERLRSATFSVYPPLFDRSQARYYVAEGRRFRPPKMKRRGEKADPAEYEKWGESLADLLKKTAWGNTLVLMTSFENVALLLQVIERTTALGEEYRIFAQTPGKSLRSLVDEYRRAVDKGERAMLITGMGGYTGVNLEGDYLNTLFVGKLPLEPRSDYYKRRGMGMGSYQQEMRKSALLTFRQGIGRTLRSETDRALIVVADPRLRESRYKAFLDFLDEYALPVGRS